MIKNNNQYLDASDRLNSVRQRLKAYKNDSDNFDSQLLVPALELEESKLEDEIREYLDLRELPFDIALETVLNKHMLIDNIGELLAKLRMAAKKSQTELANELGWEQPNLSRFESENYSSQTISKIIEYASALGVYLHVIPSFLEKVDLNIKKSVVIKNKPLFNIPRNDYTLSGTLDNNNDSKVEDVLSYVGRIDNTSTT